MDEYIRAPTTFYRVEDASSCARLIEGVGIRARRQTTYTWNHTALVKLVKNHLDWWNQSRSPFISVYDDLERAQHEAERREDKEHDEVVIWEIKTTRGRGRGRRARQNRPRAEYRNLRGYAESRDFDIPDAAVKMSEYEWLFLNEIPEHMVVRNCW
jgi:hypothetical protein